MSLFRFPPLAGQGDVTRHRALGRTVCTYCTRRHSKGGSGSLQGKTVPGPPSGKNTGVFISRVLGLSVQPQSICADLNIYASPLVVTAEGITTVKYFSTNTQGSGESIQTKTIKIDKTAPEARVTFNSVTQKLEVIGIDNLSAVSMTAEGSLSQMYEKKSEKRDKKRNQSNMKKNDEEGRQGENGRTRVMTTLRDEADHTTVLVFLKEKDKEDRIDLKWQSIVYDGVVFLLRDTKMQYQWRLSPPTIYEAFSAYMRVDQSSLRLRYLPKRNETWILDKPRERDDDEEREDEENEKQSVKEKVSGMIIPSMTTEKGIIKINY